MANEPEAVVSSVTMGERRIVEHKQKKREA